MSSTCGRIFLECLLFIRCCYICACGSDTLRSVMTNKEEIFDLIQKHPEGLDDDDISKMTGIEPRQQVQQLCNQLASVKRIRRESVDKAGKRRKIHNFPSAGEDFQAVITAVR